MALSCICARYLKNGNLTQVAEGLAVGKQIGSVLSGDRNEVDGEDGHITYKIISGNENGVFDINKTSGTLFAVRELDREQTGQYALQIRAIDNLATHPQNAVINVKIDVEDVNDCAPAFKVDLIQFSISENTPVGTPVWNFSAIDQDDGANGQVQYSVTQQWPFAAFKINPSSGILTLISSLDHEQYSDFTIVVAATDQAPADANRLSTSITARITVQDFNDNSPIFVSKNRVNVREDEPVGSPVLHIIAIDRDSEANGRVSYSIFAGNEDNTFVLNSSSGVLSVSKALDRELRSYYALNVTAKDHGHPVRSSWQIVHVQVEDINDNPPQFLQAHYEASVIENAPAGTFVVKVSATDKDSGNNGNLTYSIPDGVANGLFSIDSLTGSIITTGTLDREVKSSYTFTVYVRDGSVSSQYDTATVHVQVLDVNDHAPEFGESCYPLRVPENTDLSVIHTVVATDADSGANGEITYSITGGNIANKFSIDLHTGQLSSRPLDREARDRYFLIITAQDRGSPTPRQGYCNMTITVDDENDNDPRFSQSRYSASVAENAAPDTLVLTVQATDLDRGSNAKITYSLANETQSLFKIDSETGVLTTTG